MATLPPRPVQTPPPPSPTLSFQSHPIPSHHHLIQQHLGATGPSFAMSSTPLPVSHPTPPLPSHPFLDLPSPSPPTSPPTPRTLQCQQESGAIGSPSVGRGSSPPLRLSQGGGGWKTACRDPALSTMTLPHPLHPSLTHPSLTAHPHLMPFAPPSSPPLTPPQPHPPPHSSSPSSPRTPKSDVSGGGGVP